MPTSCRSASWRSRLLLMLWSAVSLLLLSVTVSSAQPDTDADGQPPAVENPLSGNAGQQQDAADADTGDAGSEEAENEEEEEQGDSERFIPSEEISQDLGVSFPADI